MLPTPNSHPYYKDSAIPLVKLAADRGLHSAGGFAINCPGPEIHRFHGVIKKTYSNIETQVLADPPHEILWLYVNNMPWRHYEGYKANICCMSAVSTISIFFDATMYLNTCSTEVNFSKYIYIHIHTPWEKFIENSFLPFQGMFLASSKLLQATQLWMHEQRMQGACRVGGTNKDGQPRKMAVPAGSKDVYQKEIICVYTGRFSRIFFSFQKTTICIQCTKT